MRVAIRVALIAFMPLAICTIAASSAVAALIPFAYTWDADVSWTENDVPFSSALERSTGRDWARLYSTRTPR